MPNRNLIIVLAHGLRSDALSDSLSWPLQTPNLNRLARSGLRVSAVSACPADRGGMVSLLTGLHARQHGRIDQENGSHGGKMSRVVQGWPAQLAEVGYHMAGVGCVEAIEPWLAEKVVVADPVESAAVNSCAYLSAVQAKGMDTAIRLQRDQRRRHGPFEPDRLVIDSSDDVDGFIAAKARAVLGGLPSDRPWALIVGFSGPGNDLPPPTLFEYVVDPRSVQHGFVPANISAVDAMVELDYPRVLLQRLGPEGIGRIRADYLGRVSLIDYGVGRLVGAVDERPDRDRTWVVVCSDRGQLLGEHGLVGHRSFLTGALEVPVVITPPSPVTQRVYPDLVSTVDIAPTIADLGGCDLPRRVTAGRSLLPLLTSQSLDSREWPACLSEFGGRLMMETERYKVVFDTQRHAAIGLYDRLADADELTNLVDSPVALNALDGLRSRLADMLIDLRAAPVGV